MTLRRSARRRRPRRAIGVSGLLVAVAAGLAHAALPAHSAAALDPRIPNGRVLVARGLSGVPGRHQPTAPITVDRVLTDGAATYVQFHTTTPFDPAAMGLPDLYDDRGAVMNYGGGMSDDGPPPWTRSLPSWFPWQPPAGPTQGVITLGPLPLTARAAVLRFLNGATVRVPLQLAALRRRYVGPLVARAGLRLRIVAARDTGLVLGYAPFGETGGATLTDARGRVVPVQVVADGCAAGGYPDTPLACRQVWTYPLQRHGTRLTLTIRSFAFEPNAAVSNVVGAGPWRLVVVIP